MSAERPVEPATAAPTIPEGMILRALRARVTLADTAEDPRSQLLTVRTHVRNAPATARALGGRPKRAVTLGKKV